MARLNNPLAAVLFLVVTVAGSWFVLQRGMSMRQQRSQAEAAVVYAPPLEVPMAQTALPWHFAFEASAQKLRWRRFYAGPKASRVCFWADFSPGDYARLSRPWGLEEGGRQLGTFVDGFLPAWFLEELCREELLCPGEEKAAPLRPPEVFSEPRGRQRVYAVPRLHALFGCIEEA